MANATVALQASIFNAFGCLDNIAWLWVNEQQVKATNGAELDKKSVGLGQKYREVRRSLSPCLIKYLDSIQPWFDMIIDYRDALAHRIPLYIPPSNIPSERADEYYALEAKRLEAITSRDLNECNRLEGEQVALSFFKPFMVHSLEEGARPVLFHAQLIANHATIIEIAVKFLDELDKSRSPNEANIGDA